MIYILPIIFIFIRFCDGNIQVKDAGIGYIEDGDMAMMFFITLENICESNLEINVKMIQCCDTSRADRTECNLMNLIGGDMGILYAKYTKNITLIYPNLYLMNRKGICNIQVQYQDENSKKSIVKQIEFKTTPTDGSEDEDEKSGCASVDTDPASNCNPVDCVIKYSGEQSFFNPASNECEAVPDCCYDPQNSLPDNGYSVSNNSCIDLNCSITTHDLHALENNQAYIAEAIAVLPSNMICHHGDVTDEGTCQCWFGWETSTYENEMYEPSVLQYHMCNIEKGSWNSVNRGKIKATGFIIAIFCLTVVSKLLILLCVLGFCYKQYKASRKCECPHDNADLLGEILICEDAPSDECICKDVFNNTIKSKSTVHGDGYMARRNSKRSIEYYPGDKSKSRTESDEVVQPETYESFADRRMPFNKAQKKYRRWSEADMEMTSKAYKSKSGIVRSSATDSAEISFPTDTDETTQVSSDMEGEEEDYELSTSCRCYEDEEGVCTCDDSEEDTPSLHGSKSQSSKSKSKSKTSSS